MTISSRDIEKLKAIGYVERDDGWLQNNGLPGETREWSPGIKDRWGQAKAHAQSPEGMKATMADKVRWLLQHGRLDLTDVSISLYPWGTLRKHISIGADPKMPEAAVDALFWRVP